MRNSINKVLSIVLFFGITSLAVIINSCSKSKSENSEEQQVSSFIYRDSFLLENLARTLAYCRESKWIDESIDISEPLIKKWLNPFSIYGGYKNKMISYQFKGPQYNSLLLLVVGDQLSDSASYHCYDNRQFLISVDDSDNFIDGLEVAGYDSGIDSVIQNKPVVMVIGKWSTFNQDTTWVFKRTNYFQETDVNGRDILQEEFEEIDKTAYVFEANGKIKMINKKKGELKKIAEHKVEKVQME